MIVFFFFCLAVPLASPEIFMALNLLAASVVGVTFLLAREMLGALWLPWSFGSLDMSGGVSLVRVRICVVLDIGEVLGLRSSCKITTVLSQGVLSDAELTAEVVVAWCVVDACAPLSSLAVMFAMSAKVERITAVIQQVVLLLLLLLLLCWVRKKCRDCWCLID